MANDLWPENIGESKLVTPLAVLKEQAALLGTKTQQLVTGEVTTETSGNLFVHHFSLVAPTLRYRYELFRVTHGISFYPLNVVYLNNTHAMKSEAEFKDKLKEIFSATHTVTTVQSILAQVRA